MASTTRQNYEQLSYRGPQGAMWTSQALEVIGDGVATRTLTAKESGAWCLFDRAAGVVYTLPSPVIGMRFVFATTVTVTSNAHKLITNLSTEFLVGNSTLVNTGATTGQSFTANGTTIRALSSNGSTTGGIIGDWIEVVAISSTQWFINALQSQTGVAATPFATS